MPESQLVTLSKQFAVDVIKVCEDMKNSGKGAALINQLLRSGTSIGANIHEANYASSRGDFINKMQIALKENYETDYWLAIFQEAGWITADKHKALFARCSKIRKMLIASITTAKKNLDNGDKDIKRD